MKKLLLVLLIGVIAVPMFQSCKKGENDPAISLRSRDARLIAKWKLTSITGTTTEKLGGVTTTTTYNYNGSLLTRIETYDNGAPSTNDNGSGTFTMTIDKKGLLTFEESYTPSVAGSELETLKSTGIWLWQDNDKSKTVVTLACEGNELFGAGTYVVDGLKNSELILKVDYTGTYTQGNQNAIDNGSVVFTFEAEK